MNAFNIFSCGSIGAGSVGASGMGGTNNTPLDETGDYDYESLYALDLDLFNKDLNRLLQGETIEMPTYNFETGEREYRGNTLKLEQGSVLILEGIHGLNPDWS